MRTSSMLAAGCSIAVVSLLAGFAMQPGSSEAPKAPPIVTPGGAPAQPGKPPSDAVVLFDGTAATLANWTRSDGKPMPWEVQDGAMVAATGGGGSVLTKESFGDCQLHIEFATPAKVEGEGQGRGNSGVYFQARYEVQVLDSYKNETYPDGQCASIYKQHPPLVNACRGPGEWQTYDIIFRAARFDASGKKVKNATITVFHNGVLVQDHADVSSPTGAAKNSTETPGEPGGATGSGPIYLQDHGNPVRYRNVWVRKL